MKTWAILFALNALLVCSATSEAGSFANQGCRAEWDDGTLTVSNAHFARTFRAIGGTLQTVSFRRGATEWIAATNASRVVSGVRPRFTAEKASWSCVGEEGLRVTAIFPGVTNTYLVLPSLAGVIAERTKRVSLDLLDPALRKKRGDYSIGTSWIHEGRIASTGADTIVFAPLHVRATAFDLVDRTDFTNELESEREWLLMMRELPRRISANVMAVENTFTGEGLLFVRLAPLLNVRPEPLEDYVLVGAEYGPSSTGALVPVDNGWPIAEFAYAGGEIGRTAALQRFQRALRKYRPGRDGVLLSNNWGGGHGDRRICEDFIQREIAAGGELGVDVLEIDDGWQKGRSANSSDIAGKKGKLAWGNFRQIDPTFWEPCPKRLPHGLDPLIAAAKAKGMRFGLWYGPESHDEARYWRDDAATLLKYYREKGIANFKIDSLKTPTARAYANQRQLFDTLVTESDGMMTFDLDVTFGERPGYFGLPHIGPIFVENRYTQHGGYWPHQTLRSIWSLTRVIDPVRMRIEFLDPDKYPERYSKDDPLRPELFRADTLFAIALCASPLAWMELSELAPNRRAELKPAIARWKAERDHLYSGVTHPVGTRPNGRDWSGFLTATQDGGGYLLLFRMLNTNASFTFDPRPYGVSPDRVTVIGGRGTARIESGKVRVDNVGVRDYIWVKLDKSPASWAAVLERVDAPASGFVWARGDENGAVANGVTYPIHLSLTTATNAEGRTAVGSVRNATREWRIKRLFVRPFSETLAPDFRALYFPAGLGARYSRLPEAGATGVTNGWARAARPDGENRYLLNCEWYIHPDAYPNWSTSMAWLALDFAGQGVYWGAHDPSFGTKRIQPLYEPATRQLTFEVGYEIMLDPGETIAIPQMVERRYHGDWHKGADVYRAWMTQVQPPPTTTPRDMTGQLLCILKQQNGEICWPYGEFDRLADAAMAHGLNWVGLFGWTVGGHDHLYPEYNPDPAMGGREGLKAGIQTLHQRGIKCYLYANGQLLEREATDFWRTTGKRIAIVAADDTPYTEHWNKFKDQPPHTFSMACLQSAEWGEHLLRLAQQAAALGADGILYDQLGNADPKACYAPHHGHKPGVMAYAGDKATLMRQIKTAMAQTRPDFMFASEGIGDIFRDTYNFFHGMSTGAHTYWSMANVLNRFAGKPNEGADIFPEMFPYTFPDIVSTCRMPSPFLTRHDVNYCMLFGLRFEIEVRYRPDRTFIETGTYAGDAAYDAILGPPDLKMMATLDQRAAQRYLKCVSDFRRRWGNYLLRGRFCDTVGVDVKGVVAKRFEAADGTSAILAWNTTDVPTKPVWGGAHRFTACHAPEEGAVALSSPIPPNALRLYLSTRAIPSRAY